MNSTHFLMKIFKPFAKNRYKNKTYIAKLITTVDQNNQFSSVIWPEILTKTKTAVNSQQNPPTAYKPNVGITIFKENQQQFLNSFKN